MHNIMTNALKDLKPQPVPVSLNMLSEPEKPKIEDNYGPLLEFDFHKMINTTFTHEPVEWHTQPNSTIVRDLDQIITSLDTMKSEM